MPKDELSAPTPGSKKAFASPGTTETGRHDSLVGRVLGDRFELIAPLGRGGAGDVYRALQKALGREVALKVLRPELQDDARGQFEQRFLREAALAGRLKHPNIVTVHDHGVDQGIHYVVMELLEGRTLASALRAGPMDPEEAARIGIGVARGLRHAHEQGLIHRDVKPHNVMLVKDDDGREQPKLMDFGLVKSTRSEDDSMTLVGQFMGTPAFMAPEQARGGQIDARADLYSLGVMLFRMLAGALPYDADHALGMAMMHQTEPVPTIAKVAPDVKVPPELEAIVRRAMAKKPEDRWPDAAAMADALEFWLDRRTRPPITFPPDPPPQEPRRWGFVAAVVGALSVVGGLLLVSVGVAGIAIGWWSGRSGGGTLDALPTDAVAAPVPEPSDPAPAVGEPVVEPPPDAVPEPPAPEPPAPEPPVAAPEPRPAPDPRPSPAPEPRPAPGPRPSPAPRPAPAPAPGGGLVIDDVTMTASQAAALVKFVNTATPDQLHAAGVYDRGVGVILQNRPFPSAEAFGETPGIGTKTVQACVDAGK